MTTRDIKAHLAEVYGVEVSHETVVKVTGRGRGPVLAARPVDDVNRSATGPRNNPQASFPSRDATITGVASGLHTVTSSALRPFTPVKP
jgi:hypothetical protein